MEPLDAAQGLIGQQFPEAIAAFLGGSVLTHYRTATSDLDIVVVLAQVPAPYRKTIRYGSWLVELFVNTQMSLRHYWALDATARKASLLRMCADGRILIDSDNAATTIQVEARARLAAGPSPLTSEELRQRRYKLTDLLDDLDGCDSNAEMAYIASCLLIASSELMLLSTGQWIDTGKWLARRLAEVDNQLAVRMVAAHQAAVGAYDKQPLRQVVTDVLDRAGGPLMEGYFAQGTR